MTNQAKMRVFDFFSGCGGTSLGLAQSGMDVVFGLDFDRDSSLTFGQNIRPQMFVQNDIRSVPADLLASAIMESTGPTVFSGCAPCQPFSKQNRSTGGVDPRRNLLKEFVRFVERWRPDYLVVENVPGLQRVTSKRGPLQTFKASLDQLGYFYTVGVLPFGLAFHS
jgi:DNA (cytosine-5)-methyltransferase 1